MDIKEKIQHSGFPSNSNTQESLVSYCEDNFYNKILYPKIEPLIKPTIFNRIFDRATGINSWLVQVSLDSCNGEYSRESGKLLANAVVKTGLNSVAVLGAGVAAAISTAAASPVLITGSFLAGGALVFGIIPWASEKIVDGSIGFFERALGRIKESY